MKIVISSAHGKYVRGARGNPVPPQLDEVDEARKVVEVVAGYWRSVGVEVTTFHDDTSTSQNQNLNTIVDFHNAQPTHDYDVSVHFNAYQNTAKPMGTECLYVTQQQLAADLAHGMAVAGGFINRGAKYRSTLFFLNNTRAKAVLLEVCFCDSTADSDLYHANFEDICRCIAEVIARIPIGPPIEPPVEPETPPPDEVAAHVEINITTTGPVTVTINGQDFMVNEPGPEMPAIPVFPPNQMHIVTTVFGGDADLNNSAYPPYDTITDQELSVALPARLQGPRPDVLVMNVANGKTVVTQIRDIGPWMTTDDYWAKGTRPLAEMCYAEKVPLPSGPHQGKVPRNAAGIDLTPAAAKAIGLDGKGFVNWAFVTEVTV